MTDRDVRVYEVGPRDGLQNEASPIPTEAKLSFIALLADAGLTEIEATSFVSPHAIPQLADADDLMARLDRRPGVRYPATLLTAGDEGSTVVDRLPDVPLDLLATLGVDHRPYVRRAVHGVPHVQRLDELPGRLDKIVGHFAHHVEPLR